MLEIYITSSLESLFKPTNEFGKFPASHRHTIQYQFHNTGYVYSGSVFVAAVGMFS